MRNLIEAELTRDETALFHHLYRNATRQLAEQGHLPPLAHFRAGLAPNAAPLKTGDIATVMMDMPGNDVAKDVVAAMLRRFAHRVDADLIILLFESWMVKPTAEEAAYYMRHQEFRVRPSEHPQRIEILLVSVSKPGGHQWSAWVEIQRDAQGNPLLPDDPPTLEYLTADGRFGNLFENDGSRPSLS